MTGFIRMDRASVCGRRETLPMRSLTSSRLSLEPLRAEHAECMFDVLADPALYEYEGAPPRSLAWLRERYARLESRRSPDGSQQWLNWVLRMRGGAAELIGYVQATVCAEHTLIAYELHSGYWHRGLAFEAVTSMLDELALRGHARQLRAVLKAANRRSLRLLDRLGFEPATAEVVEAHAIAADELLMIRGEAADRLG